VATLLISAPPEDTNRAMPYSPLGNTVQNNTAYHNTPADIVDHSGGHNTFRGNFCGTSVPRGLCRH